MITTAKGITNGAVPMGAVFASRKIHDALMTGPAGQIELFHGYTYSAHPVACAAGIATLDIYKDEGLLTRGAAMTDYWQDGLHSLKGLPNVIDIRNVGLMGAIELSRRARTRRARAAMISWSIASTTASICARAATSLAVSPPLIVETQPHRRHGRRSSATRSSAWPDPCSDCGGSTIVR